VKMGAAQILRSVDIEEPSRRRQSLRMSNLAALNQRLNRKPRQRLAPAGSGGLERGEAAPAPGPQFPFEHRQDRPLQHHREGLGESIDRGGGDSSPADPCVAQQGSYQRGRQQR